MALQVETVVAAAQDSSVNSGKNYYTDEPVYIKKLDGQYADIFDPSNNAIQILQDGFANRTDDNGEFSFAIEAGEYIIEIRGLQRRETYVGADYFNNRIDETVNQIVSELSSSRGFRVVGSFGSEFTYELPNDVASYDDGLGNVTYWIYSDASALPQTIADTVTDPNGNPNFEQVTFNQSSGVINDDGSTTQNTHDALKAALIAQGLSGDFGFFADGFTYVAIGDIGIDVDGKIYIYSGSDPLPVTVTAGTDPVGDSDYELKSFQFNFNSFQELVSYPLHKEGNKYSLGSTVFKVTSGNGDYALSGGLYLTLSGAAHANDFADSLNEAVQVIGGIVSRRVKVVTGEGMAITDTVDFQFDCDLEASTLQLTTNLTLKPVFTAVNGWSGTTSPCIVDGNNFSALRGFRLQGEGYGVITLDNMEFRNFGDSQAETSDSSWIGFSLLNKNSGEITLINPTCRDIYVKPNSVIGDAAGACRNVVVTGIIESGDTPTNINIKGHTSINLLTEEDADAVVVEARTTGLSEVSLNVDIYDGYSYNCQKRMYKFQTEASPSYTVRGVRLHGSSYANAGDSIKAVSPLDIQQGFALEANGTLTYEGDWIYGLRSKQGVLRGDLMLRSKAGDSKFINGNTTRVVFADTSSDLELLSISGFGQYEVIRTDATTSLKVKNGIDFNNNGVLGSAFGTFECGHINYRSNNQEDLSSNNGTLISTANIKVTGQTSIDLTPCPTPPRSGIRCSGNPIVSFMDIEVFGAPTASIELNNVPDAKLIRPENTTTTHTVRLEGNNGNIFIDGGRNPTSITFQPSGTTTNLISVNERLY